MPSKHGPVGIVAEQVDCRIQDVSLQLIGKGRTLADELGVDLEAVLLGNGIADLSAELFAAGADQVLRADSPDLAVYQPEAYTEIIVQCARERAPEMMLLGSSTMGRELAPLVAARLETGLTAHCIELVLDENGILVQQIPAYGGLLSIICPQRRPQMATVAKGVFPTPAPDHSRSGEIIELDLPADLPNRIQTLEIVRETPAGVPLESAPIVIAGGAGAGDNDGWGEIAELADVLNAGLGCTRPAVDEGWAELETMIGQSGKMVNPECYIGVGLSGEQQHMVGIVDARLMVAINNDDKSPVFEQVDFGVVDDCRKFLPVLMEKINRYKEKQSTC